MARRILCAGPTAIAPAVLDRMTQASTNPDLDPAYLSFHQQVIKKYQRLLNTEATTFMMLGEAMVALEGAVVSLVEPGDRVLVLSNGVYGQGFADYVRFVGGEPVVFSQDHRHGLDLDRLAAFLAEDHDFALATMVHCETPTGVTNDLAGLAGLLNRYGILSIVDSVSGIGGEKVDFDAFGLDCILCGSQKVLSAPTGLALVTLSKRAEAKIADRQKEVPSFYLNFKNYYAYDDPAFAFPYTMSEHLTAALDEALDRLLAQDYLSLHARYARLTRETVRASGLSLYALDHFASTVTAVCLPEGLSASQLLDAMRAKDILISKGVGPMADRLFRIGHMGNNISEDNFRALFAALDQSFTDLGYPLDQSLEETFTAFLADDRF
ncbi:pyridoxal-phosphate-dependent aminotransferase family protein [Peptococcus simiae]|uniref:Pyridoxal-phosphate-dependent aminotransferase family protein n=1 Tax=Peptococcus simiae TaxID=1643805 RepID=A0ABW9H0A2_9FIRM